MEIVERIGLYVYLYYNRDARKLNKYGDFHYQSKSYRYVLFYVDKVTSQALAEEIEHLKFVKEVRLSELDNIDRHFVGNLNS